MRYGAPSTTNTGRRSIYIDAQGRIRHHQFGEGEYEQSERVIQQLLTEAGATGIRLIWFQLMHAVAEVAADWVSLKSAENYVGYERTENFASRGGAVAGKPNAYATPARLKLNDWRCPVNGQSRRGPRCRTSPTGESFIASMREIFTLSWGRRYRALPYVFACSSMESRRAPRTESTPTHKDNGTVTEQRLYQLIRQPQPIADRQVEIEFSTRAFRAFAFTFADRRPCDKMSDGYFHADFTVHTAADSAPRNLARMRVAVGLRHIADAGRSPVLIELQPSPDSPLVRIARESSPAPTLSGFRLMPIGFYSLDARIQLARRAVHSLDVQYYLIQNDRTGRLLMRNLRDAALRGVRVRLLVDDLYTSGGDAMFRDLAAFPNVEVRLFNPFCCARQSTASKYFASIGDFSRLNHRMHNKALHCRRSDGSHGRAQHRGRVLCAERDSNFIDMDVFVVGSVVGRLASIFDVYWNSPQAYSVQAILGQSADAGGGATRLRPSRRRRRANDVGPRGAVRHSRLRPIGEDFDAGRLRLVWGTAVAFADQPAKVMATSAEMARTMSVQMNIMDRAMAAKRDVVISSPYFIPGRWACEYSAS